MANRLCRYTSNYVVKPFTERIYFNGLRSTAYTANSSGGKIVFSVAPTINDSCIADFQLYSTKSYSDTGWLPTT